MRTAAMDLTSSFLGFSKDIKLAHSIFALPFAASALIIGHIQFPTLRQVFFLILAMVAARSFAMGMNRYIDRQIDARNPRTMVRGIPSSKISPQSMLAWSLFFGAILVFAAFSLNRTVGYLAFPLLLVLMFYSYWKRFSWLAHWYLGLCLGFAPIAVSLALTGSVTLAVVCLGAAVALWTAGFDILYSLQDMPFDKQAGLKSVPAYFGAAIAVNISRLSFVLMITLLMASGILANLGSIYYLGVFGIAGILAYEHYLVREAKRTGTSSNINAAFFNANAYVSVAFFALTLVDALV